MLMILSTKKITHNENALLQNTTIISATTIKIIKNAAPKKKKCFMFKTLGRF